MPVKKIALLVVFAAATWTSNAQVIDFERSRYSPAAYYNYSEQGDVTILVNVWGTVRNPGMYEVPTGTTMSALFSLAGGPRVDPRDTRTRRTVTARLIREGNIMLETVMENEILSLDSDPVLAEGDMITSETVLKRGLSWRDIFPVVAAVASVALAVERISSN